MVGSFLKVRKDILRRNNFEKKELDFLIFKYGVISSLKKKNKNFYFFRFIKKFHLDWSKTRVVNRCVYTGRARWCLRRFRLSRIQFKNMFGKGEITGVKRASW